MFDQDLNKQKAIVSFIYNIGSLTDNQVWLLENNYITALWNSMLKYNKSSGKVLKWLEKRREIEYNLLTN